MPITSINPTIGEKLKDFSAFNDAEIEKRLSRADRAFLRYRRKRFAKRAQLMMTVASLLQAEKDEVAGVITLEMRTLFRAGLEEIEKCARGWRFYSEPAKQFL